MSDGPIATATLDAYLERLASAAPTPGGGAVAAVTGAQAAALIAMVVRVSEGPADLLKGLDAARQRLLALASEDGAAFATVMAAYKAAKATPAEQEARRAAVQSALKGAAQPPLEIMRIAGSLHDLAARSLPTAKANIISDAVIAIHLLGATLEVAACSVRINLDGIKDADFKAQTEAEMKRLFDASARERPKLLALTGKR